MQYSNGPLKNIFLKRKILSMSLKQQQQNANRGKFQRNHGRIHLKEAMFKK